MSDLRDILESAQAGDRAAADQLMALLYDELRGLAEREMAKERRSHTLQPTALVGEAYLRLVAGRATPVDRAGFFAAAATAIRRVLVEHARRRAAHKRGGPLQHLATDVIDQRTGLDDHDLLMLDEVLQQLAELDPRKARLVELRFFGGLAQDELAHALGCSAATVRREWRIARAWLRSRCGGEDA